MALTVLLRSWSFIRTATSRLTAAVRAKVRHLSNVPEESEEDEEDEEDEEEKENEFKTKKKPVSWVL